MTPATAPLVEIAPPAFDVRLDLRYATDANFTGAPVYGRAACYLRPEATDLLKESLRIAQGQGYGIKIFDAFRPTEAQWALWNHTPDPHFLAHPERGSPHSRGVAIDLTLTDECGMELDMGTEFDAFTPLSHHANAEVSETAQRNRSILLGIMTASGWDFYRNEWWHYQMFDARAKFDLISDKELPEPMMG